jgi:hypothetical protein
MGFGDRPSNKIEFESNDVMIQMPSPLKGLELCPDLPAKMSINKIPPPNVTCARVRQPLLAKGQHGQF